MAQLAYELSINIKVMENGRVVFKPQACEPRRQSSLASCGMLMGAETTVAFAMDTDSFLAFVMIMGYQTGLPREVVSHERAPRQPWW